MPIMLKSILLVAAMLAAGAALADVQTGYADHPVSIAQLTSAKRAWFRERWREMSPEQRERLRARLRREWRNLPPEKRRMRRQDWINRQRSDRNRPVYRHDRHWQDDGYGQGYGTRH